MAPPTGVELAEDLPTAMPQPQSKLLLRRSIPTLRSCFIRAVARGLRRNHTMSGIAARSKVAASARSQAKCAMRWWPRESLKVKYGDIPRSVTSRKILRSDTSPPVPARKGLDLLTRDH